METNKDTEDGKLNSAHSYKLETGDGHGTEMGASEESQEELVKKLFYLITKHGYKKALESFHIQRKKT